MALAIFRGTEDETRALLEAISRNCGCQVTPTGFNTFTCAAHKMLLDDQRALDGLVCSRRRAVEMLLQEGIEKP